MGEVADRHAQDEVVDVLVQVLTDLDIGDDVKRVGIGHVVDCEERAGIHSVQQLILASQGLGGAEIDPPNQFDAGQDPSRQPPHATLAGVGRHGESVTATETDWATPGREVVGAKL